MPARRWKTWRASVSPPQPGIPASEGEGPSSSPASPEAGAERHNHAGTSSSSIVSRSAATPVLRKYFWAMMSVATCDHSAGMVTPAASKTADPSGLTMRESLDANRTPSYGSWPAVVKRRSMRMVAPGSQRRAARLT